MRLAQRRAIVTGAADGIGEFITRMFVEQGARVLAVDINADKLQQAHAGNQAVTTLASDLTAPNAVAAIMAQAQTALGGLDILVNCAGITHFAPIEETSDEVWASMFAVNVTAVFRLSRAAIPLLKASPHARIINIGSVCSDFAVTGLSAYTASKHAVAGLTKSLATELGAVGIRANYLQPGAIVTGMTRATFEQNQVSRDFWINKSAAGRLGQPIDIARVALFLASDDADFVSGQGILVDGGAMQSV